MNFGRISAWFGVIAGWAVTVGTFTGCRPKETVYPVHGTVLELKPDGTNVVIAHDSIAGYMDAMTMNFDTPSAAVLRGLKTNDVVNFRLHVTSDDSWVDGFAVLSNAGPAVVFGKEPVPVVLNDPTSVSFFKNVLELKEGDAVPDYEFTNHLGKIIHLADYRGRVLALDFIFTRCPLPDFCPRISTRFRSAQNTLKERPDAPKDWHFLSLSFDPLFDTPRVLGEYGKRYEADPTHWSFATGAYEQLQPLGAHFGLYFAMNVTPDKMNHNLRTVVLDGQGRVAKILAGNLWSSEELVAAVVAAGQSR